MRLNLVGNGFDLYHGLPCSYYYFACFLAEKYPDFYREMAEMYGFSWAAYSGINGRCVEPSVDNIFWKTFEERLGKLEPTWLENKLQDDLMLECPDPVLLEIPEEVNSEIIKKKFGEWIRTVVGNEENYKSIARRIRKARLPLKKDDFYVNFNYTEVLEKVYKIDDERVYHIHGKCGLDKELIVGHGNEDAISQLSDYISRKENGAWALGSQENMNRLEERRAELHILRDLLKDVKRVKESLDCELDNCDVNPEEIRVWGLSCGDVDKPYIEMLKNKYPGATWAFSYYDESERKRREAFAHSLGLNVSEYFELNNPGSGRIKKKLVEQNNITEY